MIGAGDSTMQPIGSFHTPFSLNLRGLSAKNASNIGVGWNRTEQMRVLGEGD